MTSASSSAFSSSCSLQTIDDELKSMILQQRNHTRNHSHSRHRTKRKRFSLIVKVLSNVTISLIFFAVFTSPSNASIKPYFYDENSNKVWFKNIPSWKRTELHKYYDPSLYSVSITKSKPAKFLHALTQTSTKIFLFFKNMIPYVIQFGLFMGFFGLAGQFSRGGGGFRFGRGGASAITNQDFLEARPYWDQSNVIFDTYNLTTPFIGKIRSTNNLKKHKLKDGKGIRHIVIEHDGKFKFWEGQSIGVMTPKIQESLKEDLNENDKLLVLRSVPRLPIASTRYGDDKKGKSFTLCAKENTNGDDGEIQKYLYSKEPGDTINIIGPYGSRAMLLPEEEPTAEYIMVADNVGIVSFRGFLRRIFEENTRVGYAYRGNTWLLHHNDKDDGILYQDEMQTIKDTYSEQFRLDYDVSKEKIKDYSSDFFSKLENGAHIFFSEEKSNDGMQADIKEKLKDYATTKGIDFNEWFEKLQLNNQWHEM